MKASNLIIGGLIFISLLLIGFSFFAPFILTNPSNIEPYNFKETGPIGDTIGGLMNPFVALAGVFITFLAFYMQLKANQIQLDLFKRNQSEQTDLLKEQLFFRLVDNLHQRIINLTQSNYNALENLVLTFVNNLDIKCISLGRELLAKQPEKIDLIHYKKIVQETTFNDTPTPAHAKILQQTLVQQKGFEERWEYLNARIGSTDSTNEGLNNALKAIGHVNFYKVDFKERENIYINSYEDIYRDFGGFLDGYTKSLSYLINFIETNNMNPFFIDYLKGNLSTQELIIIFYYCASSKSNQAFRHKVKSTNLLEGLIQARNKFIDFPHSAELKMEIEFVLNRTDVSFG